MSPRLSRMRGRSEADPIFRGSKPCALRKSAGCSVPKQTRSSGGQNERHARSAPPAKFRSRPDLQGVKTHRPDRSAARRMFRSRPDLQGVKTTLVASLVRSSVPKQTRSSGGQNIGDLARILTADAFRSRPDLQGVKTRCWPSSHPRCPFRSRPDLQGVKTHGPRQRQRRGAFRSRPDLQGVKTVSIRMASASSCSEADPIFRGSKLVCVGHRLYSSRSEADPIFRGSKRRACALRRSVGFRSRPDLQGVKTSPSCVTAHPRRSEADPIFRGSKLIDLGEQPLAAVPKQTRSSGGQNPICSTQARRSPGSEADPIFRGSKRDPPAHVANLLGSEADPIFRGSKQRGTGIMR